MVWGIKLIWWLFAVWLVLRQTYWCQVKEYRWDRWWSWVKYNQGWRDLLKVDVRRPEWTLRSAPVAGMGIIMAWWGGWWAPVSGLGGVILGVIGTYPLMEWQRSRIMAQAGRKIARYCPRVITINGSYGKSSTKDFLVQILAKKFEVKATQGNENSELGVAIRILKDLEESAEVLILEMGAYKRGEIARMCQMARPDVAIVTGIGPQHIDLFGSMENSQRAEFETIEALPKGGVGIFNSDSPDEWQLIRWAKERPIKTVIYSIKGELGEVTTEGFELNGIWIPLRGSHFAQNVLGAMCVAKEMGMSAKEIEKAVKNLRQPPRSLELNRLKCGAMVIDNSYNSNKEGFEASINYLNLYEGQRYLITPGIIELGEETRRVHNYLGTKAKGLDGVFATKNLSGKLLSEGGAKVQIEENTELMMEKLKGILHEGSVLLVEGRISPALKQGILSL